LTRTMNMEEFKAVAKDQIPSLAKTLTANDIQFLVETLCEKDDKLRYNAFLLLQAYSREQPSMYGYWGVLDKKLDSDNSYQRSIGLMLLAENARWDKDGKFSKTIDKYLSCCTDEKFITARQAIRGLANVLQATSAFDKKIEQNLTKLSLAQYKENQQKLLTKDIATVLKIIQKR
jgi:hypothetical protein